MNCIKHLTSIVHRLSGSNNTRFTLRYKSHLSRTFIFFGTCLWYSFQPDSVKMSPAACMSRKMFNATPTSRVAASARLCSCLNEWPSTPSRPLSFLPARTIFTQSLARRAEAVPTTSQAPKTASSKETPTMPSKPRSLNNLEDQPLTLQEDDPSHVDWTRSYHGLSVEPFSKEASEALMAPLDPEDIEIKPDGIIYLPEIKYRRILNKAFGPGGWGLAPRGETIVTDKSVTREYALLAHGR